MEKPPFRSFKNMLLERYGVRTYKLTLNGGISCPTRDGTFGPKKGWGGCSFCDVSGSASFYAGNNQALPIKKQLERATLGVQKRFKAEKFIAYFQSYTTTLDDLKKFQDQYQDAIHFPNIVALAVATRPDCLPDEFLEMLVEYLDTVDVQLELGIQSFHNPTLDWYQRGHTAEVAIESIQRSVAFRDRAKAKEKARTRGKQGTLDVFVHLIFGAPLTATKTDPKEEIIRTAHLLNELKVDGVKIHNLHILKKTKLAYLYQKSPFPLLSLEEHLEMVMLFLRHLHPSIVILRIHGAASREEDLLAPRWSNQRAYPAQRLALLMQKNGWQQGDQL